MTPPFDFSFYVSLTHLFWWGFHPIHKVSSLWLPMTLSEGCYFALRFSTHFTTDFFLVQVFSSGWFYILIYYISTFIVRIAGEVFISFISLQCRQHLRMFSLSRLSCSSCPRPRFGGAECTILWVPSIMGLLRHVHSWGVPLGHISLRSTPRSYESKSEPFLTQSEYDWESMIRLRIISILVYLQHTTSIEHIQWCSIEFFQDTLTKILP